MVYTLIYATADAPTALTRRRFLSKADAMQFAARIGREGGKPQSLRDERDVIATAAELMALVGTKKKA
jgi:hypothetical protein